MRGGAAAAVAGAAGGANRSSRVCVPASVSIFSVLSSAQVMWRRPGIRMMPPAPYALHWLPSASSLAGSQAAPIARAARFSGTPAKSPFAGVCMRQRQSSVTTDTQ